MVNPEYLLEQTDWFKGLSPANRRALASICCPRCLKKNGLLFMEGMRGDALYILERGTVQLYKTTPEGREVVIRMIQPGELFAEVILFEQDHYPVTAAALKESSVYEIPKSRFHGLLENPDFRNDFIRILLRKQRYLAGQIVNLTSEDVEQRFFLFLKDHFGPKEEILPAMTRKSLAAAIGTTPETLSRVLLRLKRKKILVWKGKQIFLEKGFWKRRAKP